MQKLEQITKILTGLLLFLLPWQTIFIVQENMINGTKWQYGTIGFYATEIIFWITALFFLFWFHRKKSTITEKTKFKISTDRIFVLFCLLFSIYSILSYLWAPNPAVASEHGRHIMEAVILFIIIFLGPLNFKEGVLCLSAGATLPGILGLWQFFTQSSFDSTWFGLSAHPTWTAGASVIADNNIGRFLRAYGSFSHPNIFGGYLVLCLTLLSYLTTKIHQVTAYYWIKIMILSAALFLTWSRSAWLALTIFLFILFIWGLIGKNKKMLFVSVYITFIFIILSTTYFPVLEVRLTGTSSNEISSVNERLSGINEAMAIIRNSPILGAGAGNYTLIAQKMSPGLPGWSYQPVHNVFLLILAELGIVGIILLLSAAGFFIFSLSKKLMLRFYLLLPILIILMLFDHYLFSLYSGLIISAVYLGLIARPKHENF